MSDEDGCMRAPGCWTLLILILTIGLAIRVSIMIDMMKKVETRLDKIEKTLKLETEVDATKD